MKRVVVVLIAAVFFLLPSVLILGQGIPDVVQTIRIEKLSGLTDSFTSAFEESAGQVINLEPPVELFSKIEDKILYEMTQTLINKKFCSSQEIFENSEENISCNIIFSLMPPRESPQDFVIEVIREEIKYYTFFLLFKPGDGVSVNRINYGVLNGEDGGAWYTPETITQLETTKDLCADNKIVV